MVGEAVDSLATASLPERRRKQREDRAGKAGDSNQQEQKRDTEPQTAAGPSRSGAAQSPCQWLAATAGNATVQAVEFEASDEREGDAHKSRGKPVSPVSKGNHVPSLMRPVKRTPTCNPAACRVYSRSTFNFKKCVAQEMHGS